MFMLAEIPLAGLLISPDKTDAMVDRANAWFTRNGRTIAMVICGVLGIFLIVRGISHS